MAVKVYTVGPGGDYAYSAVQTALNDAHTYAVAGGTDPATLYDPSADESPWPFRVDPGGPTKCGPTQKQAIVRMLPGFCSARGFTVPSNIRFELDAGIYWSAPATAGVWFTVGSATGATWTEHTTVTGVNSSPTFATDPSPPTRDNWAKIRPDNQKSTYMVRGDHKTPIRTTYQDGVAIPVNQMAVLDMSCRRVGVKVDNAIIRIGSARYCLFQYMLCLADEGWWLNYEGIGTVANPIQGDDAYPCTKTFLAVYSTGVGANDSLTVPQPHHSTFRFNHAAFMPRGYGVVECENGYWLDVHHQSGVGGVGGWRSERLATGGRGGGMDHIYTDCLIAYDGNVTVNDSAKSYTNGNMHHNRLTSYGNDRGALAIKQTSGGSHPNFSADKLEAFGGSLAQLQQAVGSGLGWKQGTPGSAMESDSATLAGLVTGLYAPASLSTGGATRTGTTVPAPWDGVGGTSAIVTLESADPQVGVQIKADAANFGGAGASTWAVNWQNSADGGTTWVNCTGTGHAAAASSAAEFVTVIYTPNANDQGKLLRVTLTNTPTSGTGSTATSPPSNPVVPAIGAGAKTIAPQAVTDFGGSVLGGRVVPITGTTVAVPVGNNYTPQEGDVLVFFAVAEDS